MHWLRTVAYAAGALYVWGCGASPFVMLAVCLVAPAQLMHPWLLHHAQLRCLGGSSRRSEGFLAWGTAIMAAYLPGVRASSGVCARDCAGQPLALSPHSCLLAAWPPCLPQQGTPENPARLWCMQAWTSNLCACWIVCACTRCSAWYGALMPACGQGALVNSLAGQPCGRLQMSRIHHS
jgi:hypothetical protein